jgi:hypothetical protein
MKRSIAATLGMALLLPVLAMSQTTREAPAKSRPRASHHRTEAVTAADLQALKDAIAAQQEQIQKLQQQVRERDAAFEQAQRAYQDQVLQAQTSLADAQTKAQAAESTATQQKTSVDKLSADLADVKLTLTNSAVSAQEEQKRVSSLEGVIGRFRLSGDIRVRGESFFQGYSGCAACFDRNRARVRVRFGFDGKVNEDFTGGVALATGSLGDPTTTNETMTNFFDRKTIGLDRAYVTYNPVSHKWLSVTGGKFAYQWQRTQVTGDPDINPEGFTEKLSFDIKNTFVKNFSIQGMQLLMNENTNAALLRAHDAFAVGGQLSTRLDLGFMTTTPSVTFWNFLNADELLNASAFAVQATQTPPGATPSVTGFPGEGPGCQNAASQTNNTATVNCAFSPNGVTNATSVGADGRVHFVSHFLYGDVVLNNQIKTGIAKLPFNLLLEAEQNLRAAGHPLDRNGVVRTDLGRQSHVYLIDASLGQTKNKGDVQFGYAFLRQEQDAVLSAFAESDQRAPTNIVQHRVYGLWKLRSNTVASYTLWLGRTLNPSLQHATLVTGWPTTAPIANEPILKRMQFDLIYSF